MNWKLPLIAMAVLAAGCEPAGYSVPPAPSQEWRAPGQPATLAEFETLARDFPDSASAQLRLLNARLGADDTEGAGRQAIKLTMRGYAFSVASEPQVIATLPEAARDGFTAQLSENRLPLEASKQLTTIPVEAQLVESVVRDPVTGDLFASTIVSHALYVKRGDADWQVLPVEGAGSLSGLAFDPTNGLLWVSSGVYDQTPDPEFAYRGLIALDAGTGKVVRRVAAPEGGTPSDIAVSDEGVIFASDPHSGAVYRALPGAASLDVLVPAGMFRSPQGIAPLPESNAIVVSDYSYGLALVDGASGSVIRIASRVPQWLDGIDGVWRHGNKLIAVQNGHRPMRIVEIELAEDLLSVTSLRVLERAHSGWTEPVGGGVDGDELIYVATGQWDRFGHGGQPTDDQPPIPTVVRILQLGELVQETPR